MRDAVQEFMTFNRPYARRNQELMRFKIARMAENPFAFFRGTFHLFAMDVVEHTMIPRTLLNQDGVEMDLVGDIHGENYGTYKAEDGLIHYDINDFDETMRGHFDFDVCRFAINVLLSSQERRDSLEEQTNVVLGGISTYLETLVGSFKKGKFIDLDFSEKHLGNSEAVAQLIRQKAAVKRSHFITELTEDKNGQRQIKRFLLKYFTLSDAEKTQGLRLLDDFRRRYPPSANQPDFYQVHDICGRISGIGSMGRYRYVVLVTGKGNQEKRNVLLEFKEARPSAYDLYRNRENTPQALLERAEKVTTTQRQSQAVCSPYLGHAIDGEMSFQVREISPHADRVDIKGLKTFAQFLELVKVHASILARTHARAAARSQGPSNPLPELAEGDRFRQRVLAFTLSYGDVVYRDWSRFVAARAELDNVSQWQGQA